MADQQRDDGGPAFPTTISTTHDGYATTRHEGNNGLSIRDYFAAQAMARLINGPSAQNICDRDPRYDETNFAHVVAVNAYEFADAMLAARGAA